MRNISAILRPKILRAKTGFLRTFLGFIFIFFSCELWAQPAPPPPPLVGTVEVQRTSITETQEFPGRIQAIGRVTLVARITGFIEQKLFEDGGEVKKGDLLYKIEEGIYKADVQAKAAAIDQIQAQLDNATVAKKRAEELMRTAAGSRATYDAAWATERSFEAQLQAAHAELRQAELNLSYTQIHAPIDGKIGRTLITEGNLVNPTAGPLASLVSQDPIYVTFAVPVPIALKLIQEAKATNRLDSVNIKIRLPNAEMYTQVGKVTFIDNQITTDTDTIMLRGIIANPPLSASSPTSSPPSSAPTAASTSPPPAPASSSNPSLPSSPPASLPAAPPPLTSGNVTENRALIDGEFVTVILSAIKPMEVLAIPRLAILTDQRGTYVYVVDQENKVQQRYVQLGQSTSTFASILHGVTEKEQIIVEGLQRVRPGVVVRVAPASPTPNPKDH